MVKSMKSMAYGRAIASSGGTSTASVSAVAQNLPSGTFSRFFRSSKLLCLESDAVLLKDKKNLRRTVSETKRSTSRKSEPEVSVASTPGRNTLLALLEDKVSVSTSEDVYAKPVEDIYKTEKFSFGEIHIPVGGVPPPSLFSWGLNAGQIATGYEQSEIQVPIDMVLWIVGKNGETIRDICYESRTRIQLLKPNPSDIEQSEEWKVRITGGMEEMETGRHIVKCVMDFAKDIMDGKVAPLSSGFSQQPTKLSQSCSQRDKAKFGNHTPQQHNGPQPTHDAQGGPTTHSGHGPPQDLYGKPTPQGPPPHAQPVEAQTYGLSMPPPQQQHPNAPSGHVQTCSFYPPAAASSRYGQQAFPLAGEVSVSVTGGFKQVEIEVPIEKVDWILGFGGETIRTMNKLSTAQIELKYPDGEKHKNWFVRIVADEDEMSFARQMIKDVMNPIWFSQQQPQPTRYAQGAAHLTQAHLPGYDQSGGYDGCSSRSSSVER